MATEKTPEELKEEEAKHRQWINEAEDILTELRSNDAHRAAHDGDYDYPEGNKEKGKIKRS